MTVLGSLYVVRVIDQDSSGVNVGGVGTLGALVMGVVDEGGVDTSLGCMTMSMGSGVSSECEEVEQKEENRKRKHKDRG